MGYGLMDLVTILTIKGLTLMQLILLRDLASGGL